MRLPLLLLLSLLFATTTVSAKKAPFIRVYDKEGNKISKGRIVMLTDTSLTIKKGDSIYTIRANEIGSIRSKRSGGHNVLIGSITGAALLAIGGIATAEPDAWIFGYTAGEGAAMGAAGGATAGGIIGAITTLFKDKKKYKIAGQPDSWKKFKQAMGR